LLIVLLVAYIFLVNQTVHQIVERKELESQNSILSSQVSEREFAYMRHKNAITPEFAYQGGFREANKTTYVSRISEATLVTLNR